MPHTMPTVLIPLAQGCEELETVTLIDLLRRANIHVITASLDEKPVKCARDTVILADTTLAEVIEKDFDLLVLPGGLPGADNLNADSRIHQLINQQSKSNKLIGAICAAPKVLVTNGILDGKKATAYPSSLDLLDTSNITLTDAVVQVDGNIITSKGPGTAIDFALTLIELLLGNEAKLKVEEPLCRS